jgi:membrane associated rhomboid family serine protease
MVFSGLGFLSFRSSDLITWGGNYGPELHGLGVIRLLTSQFVHGGLMHVANNMYALLFAGALLLPVLGNVRLLGAYLLSGLGGSGASAWMHPEIVSVGASGAIFGLFGVLLARVLFKDEQAAARRQAILTNVALFVALNLAIGFTSPGIDNAAHIGGLATGLILGALLHLTKGQGSANGDPSEPA